MGLFLPAKNATPNQETTTSGKILRSQHGPISVTAEVEVPYSALNGPQTLNLYADVGNNPLGGAMRMDTHG